MFLGLCVTCDGIPFSVFLCLLVFSFVVVVVVVVVVLRLGTPREVLQGSSPLM